MFYVCLGLWMLMAVFPLISLSQDIALGFAFNQCMWGEGRSPGHAVARANA